MPGTATSGYSDRTDIQHGKAAGFSEYLVKPVEEQNLLQVVSPLIGQAIR